MLVASGNERRISLLILPGKIIPSCRKGHNKVMEVHLTTRAMEGA